MTITNIFLVVNADENNLSLMSMNNGRRKQIPVDDIHKVGDTIEEVIELEEEV